MKIPRILLAAGASGSGKTLITCGLLQALVNRKLTVASYKCGPDYIDPMFHSRVIGTRSRNLDTFFTGAKVTNYLLSRSSMDCDIAVMEGVMGYYDGVGGTSSKASAYNLAETTDTPVILIVNSKGMSVSLAAYIKGFLDFKENSHIAGVIFNQMSPMLYPRMKTLVEESLGITVFGYVPKVEDCVIESRHLGLVLPEEIPELKEKLKKLADILEKTLDIDGILQLAKKAPEISEITKEALSEEKEAFSFSLPQKVKLAVASDEAFCFFYEDNFQLLKEMNAELVFFSPLHDKSLPKDLDGILFYGGYPELYGEALEKNESMKEEILEKLSNGLPCMAECGGFMYLHEEMEDMEGNVRKMVGTITGKVFRTNKLSRFGYVALQQKQPVFEETGLGEIPAHEFHYFDSENCGKAFFAKKPMSSRTWQCLHGSERMLAGFPHLYYYGNPNVAKAFLLQCYNYQSERQNK